MSFYRQHTYQNGHYDRLRPRYNQSSDFDVRQSSHGIIENLGVNTAHGNSNGKNSISSSRVSELRVKGSDLHSGVNEIDLKFTKLSHHSDLLPVQSFSRPSDNKKNYFVLYDPELDKSLKKHKKKLKLRKIRFAGEGVHFLECVDPRNIKNYFSKPDKTSKKYPFKQLPQPRFVYDKDSLGDAPSTEIVVWDLPNTVDEVYLANFIRGYGDGIKDLKMINDPENGVSLGIAVFKFDGSIEKSVRLAENFMKRVQSDHVRIDGVELKVALNDANGNLLAAKVDSSNSRLRALRFKREEELKKLKKSNELREKAEKLGVQKEEPNESSLKAKSTKYQTNTTVLSVRKNNRIISGVFLPKDLRGTIRNWPYILIQNKYVSTRRIPTQDIKRCLNKYDWDQVISDFTGFYVIFHSINECERCFYNEDGRNFYEYKMFMEMAIPDGCNIELLTVGEEDDFLRKAKKHNLVDEAVNILIKDFKNFLSKDIRERIIAPAILDLLNHEHYPELLKDIKAREEKELETKREQKVLKETPKAEQRPISYLPSFKKKQVVLHNSLKSGSKSRKRNHIALRHALDYDDQDSEESEDERTRSSTPRDGLYEAQGSPDTATEDLSDVKRRKTAQSLLYESSDEDQDDQVNDDLVQSMEIAEKDDDNIGSNLADRFMATTNGPELVCPEDGLSSLLSFTGLQSIIKDEEDLELAKLVLENQDSGVSKPIENIDYFTWKAVLLAPDWQEVSEDVDLIKNPDISLENATGSFRSEGYHKIPEAEKIAYMPLRRHKLQRPIKTIQNDDEDFASSSAAGQSSRVNRANNRRFAADIAHLGSETEVLSLNTLTKRKKPVSFARSAIHNWGLYALEPIAAKEMIIEYVGESIRQQVAEHRERSYMKTGIGSSYLFRIDEQTVIDATKKGGIARFINHCCNPSCTAKIIKAEGKKRIVIYALKDIDANEELTYDYKFERETNDAERIPCLCGAPGCKGFLN